MLRSRKGGDALSDRLSINGSDGVGGGEGTGEGEMNFTVALSALSRKSVIASTDGAGFTDAG